MNTSNIQLITPEMFYFDTHTSNIPFMVYQQKKIIELEKTISSLLSEK